MRPDWDIDMMILTRKIGESLIINKDICITMLGIHENNIRLGINEPKSISMKDKEIHLNMKNETEKNDANKKQARVNDGITNKTIN